MRLLYSLLVRCAAPLAFVWVLWRALRNPEYRGGLAERFGGGGVQYAKPTVWLHAVSMGEMAAAAPLVRALQTRYPQYPLLLTTATPAGRARAQALFPHIDVRFLPYDTPGAMRRFLARTLPTLAIIIETELWPNLFDQCARRGIPVVLASARLSARSVSRYTRFASLFGTLFTRQVTVAAQSAQDRDRFAAIGAPAASLQVIGNIKFDLQVEPGLLAQGQRLRQSFGTARPVWIAGSTHAGEEEQVLSAHRQLLDEQPHALLLLVPRHQARFAGVADLLARSGLSFIRRSQGAPPLPDTQVVLVDTLGELGRVIRGGGRGVRGRQSGARRRP